MTLPNCKAGTVSRVIGMKEESDIGTLERSTTPFQMN